MLIPYQLSTDGYKVNLNLLSCLKRFFLQNWILVHVSDWFEIYVLLVHPCDKEDKGECEETCEKKGETFICSCPPGSKLNADGKKCDKSK